VFSVQSKTAFVADGKPGAEPFGKGFFSKRFAKLRKEIGISSDYTIYGLKHTRVIHLKSAGASDADIMALTGHSTYDAFSRYLRDLGMTANPEVIDRLGRTM
jgi:integrase